MSGRDEAEDQVHVIPLPDPPEAGTYAMVSVLQQIMHGVAQSIPFEFHPADLMSAHLKAAFDLTVLNTTMGPQLARDNLVKGLDALLGDAIESKRRSN
jgi:hypothetical protein